MPILAAYYTFLTAIGLTLMGLDKLAARAGGWRTVTCSFQLQSLWRYFAVHAS